MRSVRLSASTGDAQCRPPRRPRGARDRPLSTRNALPGASRRRLFGCTNQAGEDNRNVARMGAAPRRASRRGARRDRQPPLRLRPRGGGLRPPAVLARARPTLLAGGVEAMTRAPLALRKAGQGLPRGNADGLRHRLSAGASRTRAWRALRALRVAWGDGREPRRKFASRARRRTLRARLPPARRSRAQRCRPLQPESCPFPARRRASVVVGTSARGADTSPAAPRQAPAGVPRGRDRHRRERAPLNDGASAARHHEEVRGRAEGSSRWRASVRRRRRRSRPHSWGAAPCQRRQKALERARANMADVSTSSS